MFFKKKTRHLWYVWPLLWMESEHTVCGQAGPGSELILPMHAVPSE